MMSTRPTDDICLTHDIYDPEALKQAIADYRKHLAVKIAGTNAHESRIRLSNADGSQPDAVLAREFLNYILDLSVRAKLSAA